jgi:hypothetical protein
VTASIVTGSPVPVLVKAARDAAVLVLGADESPARLALVAAEMRRLSPAPLLIVTGNGRRGWHAPSGAMSTPARD